MNVLVLGGTGFFGRAIVERLLERGDAVTVFSRGNIRPDWWDRVDHVIGERSDVASLQQLRGASFDAVVDNLTSGGADVAALLDIAGPSIGHYVLTSSSAVYRTHHGYPPYSEDDVDRSFRSSERGLAYAVGKLEAEQVLADREDIPWTIIRPPVVLGPRDPTLRGWFYIQRLLDGGPVLLRCCAERSFRIVYSQDLARAYLGALDTPAARGQTYNVTQEEIVTMRNLVDALAAGLGVSAEIVLVSERDLDHVVLDYEDPYNQLSNFVPSLQRARRDLDFHSTPFGEWVGVTARWYRDSYEGPDSRGYGRRSDEIRLAREMRSDRFDERRP
jgi:nucleoside-diphosphate-sugar epimerase